RQRQAKIVATLGPATSSVPRIRELFEAGADVFRLNFSHGSHEDHRRRYEILRKVEEETGRPVSILMDLQGPKLRVGTFVDGAAQLQRGGRFRFDLDTAPGTAERAPLPHPEIFAALEPGMELLVDDGKLRLKVIDCAKTFAETEIIQGGRISNHKGVNVPAAVLDLSPLTAKDRKDMEAALDLGVDWVALSFVQRPEDVAEAKKLLAGRAPLLVKIEKPSAVREFDRIAELADAIMVARGDLGVELAPEDVPSVQKSIVRKCREIGKPVIVATQMLESMITNPMPTRAEASDVATAIYDGADAVMLSAESAAGEFPVEAVTMMDRIIKRTEADPLYRQLIDAEAGDPSATAQDAITAAARQVAATISASAIVTFTATGSTTHRASRERPETPILGLTPKTETARRLTLFWGVHSALTPDIHSFKEMVAKALRMAKKEGFGDTRDPIVVTAGVPFGTPGATNILRIAWLE
ncbi:MAG: pyruvate kinase, partial [Rhodospirillales bacterium]